MPRAKRRPLSGAARRELAVGALRQFRQGEKVGILAERMKQPARRLHEALDEPVERVRSRMGRGVMAEDIASDTGLPLSFIKYAMRRVHSQPKKPRRRARQPYVRKARRRRVQALVVPDRVTRIEAVGERIEQVMADRELLKLLEDF